MPFLVSLVEVMAFEFESTIVESSLLLPWIGR